MGSSWLQAWRRDKYLYALALPGVLFFLLFKYVPLGGLVIAFKDYSPYQGIAGSPWVGLEHFERFFSNPDFLNLFRNTLAISFMNLFLFFPLPIVLAILLNELTSQRFKKTIQTIVYMPHFLSWVIIVGITFLLLNQSGGVINELLASLGFAKIDFLTNPRLFWLMLTLQNIWKDAGWGTILFLAAIAGTDPQLYEAAKMDGANRFRQMWHITLPSIRNVIVILLILRIGHTMDVGFEQVFLMTNGAVSGVADVFDTYVYRSGIQQGEFSYSAAIGFFKSVTGLILVIVANRLAKKLGEEGVY
ncbi:ABC transporter permease [Paenibacillus puerhi]|uniref:ABC transporter permease n=1 Tax=Paenibacillus puerhi TaxID=2692622 RepID=UPI0013568AB6|nr:sugar ABC transporter permease [Paenibacillus puerhi]